MPGLKLKELVEPLDADPRTVHFVDFENHRLIGALRLTADFVPSTIFERMNVEVFAGHSLLSRLVVDKDYRRQGVATSLVDAAIQYATKLGLSYIWVEATPATTNLMRRLGFERLGGYHEYEAIFVKQEITILRKRLSDI